MDVVVIVLGPNFSCYFVVVVIVVIVAIVDILTMVAVPTMVAANSHPP